ncbi:programmed cell death protein 2-like [Xenopus laevis]|uniref:Programmed cell death protein 2-like n=2 Tax=Xenopus laevis TaxID=8355 RepID=A0A1L8GKN8_XENLA|nr:programmed cell death protein 2-like [Xenopus laevis]OCT84389.1 hypothetical protein XELAEV_18022542mg [Xenopus laevis]
MAQASPAQRVLLGFKDAVIESETSSWDASKIGGLPDALPAVTKLLPSCGLCSAVLCHVVQVYCPMEGSPFHRVINVFACSRKPCWGKHESWVALRSQSLEGNSLQIKETTIPQKDNAAPTDWCEDADNWGLEDEEPIVQISPSTANFQTTNSTAAPTDFSFQLEQLTLSDRLDDSPAAETVFPSYYIAVAEEEECMWEGDLNHAQRLLKEYEQREGHLSDEPESCTGKGETEKYEKGGLRNSDHIFYKFLKKISSCRQQILRYSWNGSPLYISPPGIASNPPPCKQCGGRRVFEFQLMPALVSLLQDAGTDVLLEFGTVLVFTCERNCWKADDRTPVQEFCVVQEDPDQKYFK